MSSEEQKIIIPASAKKEFMRMINDPRSLQEQLVARQRDKAQKAFDAFMEGDGGEFLRWRAEEKMEWINRVQSAIYENLDAASFGFFIEMIAEISLKDRSRRGADKTNSLHQDNQKFVFRWLDANFQPGMLHKKMAETLVPLLDGTREYETILKDITAWKKKRKR